MPAVPALSEGVLIGGQAEGAGEDDITGVAEADLVLGVRALLGRYQDDAVGCPVAVHDCSGGAFQDGDLGNVLRVDIIELVAEVVSPVEGLIGARAVDRRAVEGIAKRHAVHYDQRIRRLRAAVESSNVKNSSNFFMPGFFDEWKQDDCLSREQCS